MSKLIRSAAAAATRIPSRIPVPCGNVRRPRRSVIPEVDGLDQHDLDRWSNRIARMLLQLGAGPGAVVATAGLPRLEGAVTRWAIAKIGATVVQSTCAEPRHRAGVGVTTRGQRPELTDRVRWLVLDERSTLVGYLTGSDAPITDDELGVVRRAG